MNDLRKAAEMALDALMQRGEHHPKVYQAAEALRQALDDKPPVKSYCGGVPNYCTPQPEVCCGEYARCLKVCIPKERWFAQQKLNVDTAPPKRDSLSWVGLTDDEIVDLAFSVDSYKGLVQATEAKIKEKNGG